MRAVSRLVMVLGVSLAVGSIYAWPAQAQRDERGGQQQHEERPRANQGHVPPPPAARQGGTREVERMPSGHVNELQHVNHDHWYGHDLADDARFHLARPFEHGRFSRVGPNFRYGVARFDAGAHRFWIGGYGGFEVAAWDWPLAADWCWDCGNDFVIYDDPDHPGWYMVYNVHTGSYVHAQFLGQ